MQMLENFEKKIKTVAGKEKWHEYKSKIIQSLKQISWAWSNTSVNSSCRKHRKGDDGSLRPASSRYTNFI